MGDYVVVFDGMLTAECVRSLRDVGMLEAPGGDPFRQHRTVSAPSGWEAVEFAERALTGFGSQYRNFRLLDPRDPF